MFLLGQQGGLMSLHEVLTMPFGISGLMESGDLKPSSLIQKKKTYQIPQHMSLSAETSLSYLANAFLVDK
jgi:hypothetical protein